jgi:hypothetical protein
MSIQTEDATLLASRIDVGKYDIVILSKEFADSYEIAMRHNGEIDAIVIEIASEGDGG